MKKIVISVILVFCLIFSGCSCNQKSLLSFVNSWDEGLSSAGFTETLSYNVEYADSYEIDDYKYVKSSSLGDKFSCSITGSYTETVTVVNNADVPEGKRTDVLDAISGNPVLYKLTTSLTLTAKYSYSGNAEETFEDFIKTECYFLNVNNRLSPVYSFTENKYAVPVVTDNSVSFMKIHYTAVESYTQKNFTCTLNQFEYDADATTAEPTKTESKSNDYAIGTVVDNTTLLFAIRHTSVSKGSSVTVPAVSPSYMTAEDVKVSYDDDTSRTLIGETKAVKRMSFVSSVGGQKQIVFVQNEKSSVTGDVNRSVITEYVTPVSELSASYMVLGVLVYTLTSAVYS